MIYLASIVVLLVVAYFVISALFTLLLENEWPVFSRRALVAALIITALGFLMLFIVTLIPSEYWGNRFQHAFAGGFMAVLVCYLAARDLQLNMQLQITRLQFVVLAILLTTTLGVGNELAEFIFQEYVQIFSYQFSATIIDTWLDLASNTFGALVGVIAFTPFIQNSKNKKTT